MSIASLKSRDYFKRRFLDKITLKGEKSKSAKANTAAIIYRAIKSGNKVLVTVNGEPQTIYLNDKNIAASQRANIQTTSDSAPNAMHIGPKDMASSQGKKSKAATSSQR